MATLRQNAQDMLDVAREGIGWIALWRDGKGWMSTDLYPDIDRSGALIFEEYDTRSLQNIAKLDPRAILVNGWEHNLGDTTCMTRDSLAAALKWQYNLQHYQVVDVLNCGAHI